MVPRISKSRIIFQKMLFMVVFGTLFIKCAGQFPPPGGPEDTTPPQIVFSNPVSNTLFFNGDKIFIEFSEYVDQRSVQGAIFVSPSLGAFEFDWSGKNVEISFTEKLKENTTYVVTVGTDVKDRRRSNKMAEAYSIAFSTGAVIDSGSIVGRIYDDDPLGIMVFAYKVAGEKKDTINPIINKPDYITQAGRDGYFILPYLSFSKYRLFAVKDVYRNLLYDPQIDKFSAAGFDTEINENKPTVSGLQFMLAIEDTSPPFLTELFPLDKNKVIARFSEQIMFSKINNFDVAIRDTLLKTYLNIFSYEIIGKNSNEIIFSTEDQDTLFYSLTISGLSDSVGNEFDNQNFVRGFRGSVLEDTTKPEFLSLSIKDNSKNIPLRPEIMFEFSEPINASALRNGLVITDSAKNTIKGDFVWYGGAKVKFVPVEELLSLCKYTITLVMDSIIDLNSNAYKDSIFNVRFETVNFKNLSEMKINVSDLSEGKSETHLLVERVDLKSEIKKYSKLQNDSVFVVRNLEEGKYVLSAFRDSDRNGKYSFGKAHPFKPSETFEFYPDTIKLRARWPVDGINIELK